MALPEFGLMTKADKQKLDNINSSTYLTRAEALNVCASKSELKGYIKEIEVTTSSVLFKNGKDEVVGEIAIIGAKASPNLTADISSFAIARGNRTVTINLTHEGDGAISANIKDGNGNTYDANGNNYVGYTQLDSFTVNGDVVTMYRNAEAGFDDVEYVLTISIAETDDYASQSITINGTIG